MQPVRQRREGNASNGETCDDGPRSRARLRATCREKHALQLQHGRRGCERAVTAYARARYLTRRRGSGGSRTGSVRGGCRLPGWALSRIGDGCNASCAIESAGYVGARQPASVGNSKEPKESCADGNAQRGDGCSRLSTWRPTMLPDRGSCCVRCGDGTCKSRGLRRSQPAAVTAAVTTARGRARVLCPGAAVLHELRNGVRETGEACDTASRVGRRCRRNERCESGFGEAGAACYECGNGFKEGTEAATTATRAARASNHVHPPGRLGLPVGVWPAATAATVAWKRSRSVTTHRVSATR